MVKKAIMPILVLILLVGLAFAQKAFVYNETDLVKLKPEASDPDMEKLEYSFTLPLNENGEWQTTYGDAGEYAVKVTVSDGNLESSQDINLIVNRKEEPPVIESFVPEENEFQADEGQDIEFEISAKDLNNDALSYSWNIDGEEAGEGPAMEFSTDYNSAGLHEVEAVVSDGRQADRIAWKVDVADVGLDSVLNSISDVEIMETETAELELPDFGSYGLKVSVSEPIGDDNSWETTYNDAGEYEATVSAEGKGFSGSKTVKVLVKNNDRAPEFEGLKDATIYEGQLLEIPLKATDPDGDAIIYSVQDMPSGAAFEGSAFRWQPDYDFVTKDNFLDYVTDSFRILGKQVKIKFIAQGSEKQSEKTVSITIRDKNRPFTLKLIDNVIADEGQEVRISPEYDDPDKDSVSFSYSGWINSDSKKTGYDDAGEYIVKVTGTDGHYEASEFVNVIVKDVNRKPTLMPISDVVMEENSSVEIQLSASDEDNDRISFSAKQLPSWAKMENSQITINPGFDAAAGQASASFLIAASASDGKDTDEKRFNVTVIDVNRAPVINAKSDNVAAIRGEPVLLYINATDPDGDELSYSWDFGFLQNYEDTTRLQQRTFARSGEKEIKVTVTDGKIFVDGIITVEVV
ncbi:hypothetical protein J4212_08685 [Candidatus Woesearchaeota archaeon]|nr:hypothetical protein [Candidatus Woesearchaeota archaeon]